MMEKTLAIVFLLTFGLTVTGQSKRIVAPTTALTKHRVLTEAEEAVKDFDFGQLAVNPNNLTGAAIEDLSRNFLEAVRPDLIDKGEPVERLARIAEPIFLFHRVGKMRTVVFGRRIPMVFTWKETFVTFSTGAMEALTDYEIAALIAHETGHLYFAEALAKARSEKNDRLARIIELKCDLIALVTLSKLNIKPSNLISAVKKLIEGRSRLQIESFEAGSPSLKDREEILKLYAATMKKIGLSRLFGNSLPIRENKISGEF